jgi:Holliday junction resolvase
MVTPETKVKNNIRAYLKLKGWYYRGIGSSAYTGKGLPDAFAIRNGITLFIEAKSEKGKLTPAQAETREQILTHGGYHVVAKSIDDIIEYCNINNIQI